MQAVADGDLTQTVVTEFEGSLGALAGLGADIILLGTGDRLRFPHPSVLRALTEARIGVEVMDVRAACRTYNILLAEERQVAAALLLG